MRLNYITPKTKFIVVIGEPLTASGPTDGDGTGRLPDLGGDGTGEESDPTGWLDQEATFNY